MEAFELLLQPIEVKENEKTISLLLLLENDPQEEKITLADLRKIIDNETKELNNEQFFFCRGSEPIIYSRKQENKVLISTAMVIENNNRAIYFSKKNPFLKEIKNQPAVFHENSSFSHDEDEGPNAAFPTTNVRLESTHSSHNNNNNCRTIFHDSLLRMPSHDPYVERKTLPYLTFLTELPENFLEESEEDHIDEIYASDSAIQFDEQLLQHTMELSNLGSNSYQKMSNLGMRMEEHSIHVAEEFKISIMSVNGLEKTLTGDLIEFYDFYSANLRMECHQKKSWWIDFEGNPSKFHEFSIFFSIHELTLEDMICELDSREKIELFTQNSEIQYLLMIFHTLNTKYENKTNPINCVVWKNLILTYHHRPSQHIDDTIAKMARSKNSMSHQTNYPVCVLHAIMDCVVDGFIPEVRGIKNEVDILKDMIFDLSLESQDELLKRIQLVRSRIKNCEQYLWRKEQILSHTIQADLAKMLQAVALPYWRDIHDHLSTMLLSLESSSSQLESVQNIFLARSSLALQSLSHKLTAAESRMGTLALYFVIPTLITGLWGMNCKVPFNYDDQNDEISELYPFFGIIGLCIVCSAFSSFMLNNFFS